MAYVAPPLMPVFGVTLQLSRCRQLTLETQLSVTGADLKRQILTAASGRDDFTNSSGVNMKLITSGCVIDDSISLQQQPHLRVCCPVLRGVTTSRHFFN